jgi:hypothetical protein
MRDVERARVRWPGVSWRGQQIRTAPATRSDGECGGLLAGATVPRRPLRTGGAGRAGAGGAAGKLPVLAPPLDRHANYS